MTGFDAISELDAGDGKTTYICNAHQLYRLVVVFPYTFACVAMWFSLSLLSLRLCLSVSLCLSPSLSLSLAVRVLKKILTSPHHHPIIIIYPLTVRVFGVPQMI